MVQTLLESGQTSIKPDPDYNSPIHGAAKYGHVEVVEALKGVENPNAPQNNGDTPIHWATRNGHLEIVKILLQCCKEANDLFYKSLPLVKSHFIR